MKILKIRFQNIHSLKGEHEIDFANGILAEAGLFAITGPTGSGKSTLLDVITLSLYNRIARVDRSVTNAVLEDDGGIMTRNMGSCYAEVDYAVNGKTYRSHWSIERNRNNNLNSRKQELVEVSSGNILESGTKTPEKNQEIIRLSYQQFVKAMVLSQGEFSKLLQAPRSERNKLLEDITGAKSYRNIGRAVFQRYAAVKKKIELKEAGLQTITLLSEEEKNHKQAELKTLLTDKPKVQKAYDEQREKREVRKQLVAAEKTQQRLAEKEVELLGFFNDFEADKKLLEQHERLAKYVGALRNYDTSRKELGKLEQEQKRIQKAKDEEDEKLNSQLKAIVNLIGEPVIPENANPKIEVFRSTISKLQAAETAKRKEVQLYEAQITGLLNKLGQLDYALPSLKKPSDLEKQLQGLEIGLKEIIEGSGVASLQQLELQLEQLRNLQETAGQVLEKKSRLLQVEKLLMDASAQLKAREEKEKENNHTLVILKKELHGLESEVAGLQKTLEHQRKHQSLDAHRLQLLDEEPCPLCGALHHPYATKEPHFDANEESFRRKESDLHKHRGFIISLEENNKFRVEDMQRLKVDIELKTKEKSALNTQLDALLHRLNWSPKEDLASLETRRNERNTQIQNLSDSKNAFRANEILQEAQKALRIWQKALTEYKGIAVERSRLYTGVDIDAHANKLSTAVTESSASKKSLERQLIGVQKELQKIKQEETGQLQHLIPILAKEKIETLEQLRLAILPEEIAKKYRDRKNELELWKAKFTEKQTANMDAVAVLNAKNDPTYSFEQLSEFLTKSKEKWETLSIEEGKITQLLQDDENTRKKYKSEQEELKKLRKDELLWKTMNDFIGDANGNKFSNFVQDLTLEQLIGCANRRLAEFTDRYLLDIPTADEAEKSDTLKILDGYMGNARRSVRTLSGGETFLVSLAMAFALSDIASRNVKIESLFIDEGFGTLDPETLDQAITILEKMQNDGDRSVGVISHVGALKERITTQIQLEKSSLGHSLIRVVQ